MTQQPARPLATKPQTGKTLRRGAKRFDIGLSIRDDFMRSATPSQINWLVDRSLQEFVDDLNALDSLASCLVAGSLRPPIVEGWDRSSTRRSDEELMINGQQVMQSWEAPLMKAMAIAATKGHGNLLEVGFGLGISATMIQEIGTATHTIVECNEEVFRLAEQWLDNWPNRDIRLVKGRWQDVLTDGGCYDAILFDTYPMSESEFFATVVESTTFAQHFFATAARLLRPGGVFTYYTNEIDSLSRTHQRLLLEHFTAFTLSVIRSLSPPEDCHYWWADSMAVVSAAR